VLVERVSIDIIKKFQSSTVAFFIWK